MEIWDLQILPQLENIKHKGDLNQFLTLDNVLVAASRFGEEVNIFKHIDRELNIANDEERENKPSFDQQVGVPPVKPSLISRISSIFARFFAFMRGLFFKGTKTAD